ncbi:hypothetical protein [Flavobacterium wongokense]|uniref:hypothetical protein n=1 Tax=Flavobacterium wongokense TaxID=2910674 RepID=UPI001F41CC72|nr:hypothetical protein [Flavobacterium sp. WG47]MCF6133379.1 hypothetical protein [Flavobacterium sp. WG47]
MKKKLFTFLLVGVAGLSFGQGPCSFGTTSDSSSGAENITTGGLYEYAGAADFDVPFGTTFTANSMTFNLTKGLASIPYLNVSLRNEQNGLPGDAIMTFDALVPTSQVFLYDIPDVSMGCYAVTVNLPSFVTLEKGKYFVQLTAAAGDDVPVGWEITLEDQTYGVFDYFRFENEPWEEQVIIIRFFR